MRPAFPTGPSARARSLQASPLGAARVRGWSRRFWLAAALSALTGLGCKESKPEATAGSASTPATAASSEIVIGHYGSLTGNTAHFGQDTDKAIRLAVDEVNAAGGVLGKKVRVVTL